MHCWAHPLNGPTQFLSGKRIIMYSKIWNQLYYTEMTELTDRFIHPVFPHFLLLSFVCIHVVVIWILYCLILTRLKKKKKWIKLIQNKLDQCESMNLYRSLDSSTVSCGEETAGSFTRRRHYTSRPISKKEQDSHN